jgi:hypothetical protein
MAVADRERRGLGSARNGEGCRSLSERRGNSGKVEEVGREQQQAAAAVWTGPGADPDRGPARSCTPGAGRCLGLRGEAGIGKSALLEDAAEQAREFQLLRGFGVESEVELAFAALHQLLRPVLDRLGRLPIAQADAPRGAFGLVYVQVNRFLVELGVLGLLAEVAGEQLVLCLVDGAQRLDRASADAPVFVGRRLAAEPIVLLVAARDDDLRPFDGPGLPALRLQGLDPWGPGSCWRRRPASWPPRSGIG